MLRLMECEFLKLKRRPLVFISLVLSVFMPLAYIFFLSDVNTDVDAVNGVMSSLFQLSAYLLLMPLLVILASSLLFQELDHDTLKNLAAVPVDRTKLVLSKMLVLLLFAVGFMAAGGLVNLAVLLVRGWEPVGFWTLFWVGLEEGVIMWAGALPCILLRCDHLFLHHCELYLFHERSLSDAALWAEHRYPASGTAGFPLDLPVL